MLEEEFDETGEDEGETLDDEAGISKDPSIDRGGEGKKGAPLISQVLNWGEDGGIPKGGVEWWEPLPGVEKTLSDADRLCSATVPWKVKKKKIQKRQRNKEEKKKEKEKKKFEKKTKNRKNTSLHHPFGPKTEKRIWGREWWSFCRNHQI